jgi:hypothetical protein
LTSQADFWSTRKAKVKAEEAAEAKLLSDKAYAEIEEQHAEKTDQELLDEHNLPDPSDLKLATMSAVSWPKQFRNV